MYDVYFFLKDIETPLDKYVHSDDGFWSYEVIEEYDEGDQMIYILNMTSQWWQGGLY